MYAILKDLPLKTLLLALAAISAVILGVALVAQYGFGLQPCELCMAQRYPYMAVIILGILGFFTPGRGAQRVIAGLIALLFLADAGIGFYHTGVELHWFPGPTACTNPATPAAETIEEMRRAIMNAPLVACDQPMFHFLGLSMAAWNCIAALFLFLGTTALLWKKR